jgi:hypothetical protein
MIRGLLLVAAALSLGCKSAQDQAADVANGDDPLKALTVDVASTRYGTAYWTQQSDSNTPTWQKAKAYCGTNGVTAQGEKVNCGPVMATRYEETAKHPERQAPGTLRP